MKVSSRNLAYFFICISVQLEQFVCISFGPNNLFHVQIFLKKGYYFGKLLRNEQVLKGSSFPSGGTIINAISTQCCQI